MQGADGDVCAPECDGSACPDDTPEGVTARPRCVLEAAGTGKRYCALVCVVDLECGAARCAKTGGIMGICVYDDDTNSNSLQLSPIEEAAGAEAALIV